MTYGPDADANNLVWLDPHEFNCSTDRPEWMVAEHWPPQRGSVRSLPCSPTKISRSTSSIRWRPPERRRSEVADVGKHTLHATFSSHPTKSPVKRAGTSRHPVLTSNGYHSKILERPFPSLSWPYLHMGVDNTGCSFKHWRSVCASQLHVLCVVLLQTNRLPRRLYDTRY